MRLLLLSDANSSHTLKWVRGITQYHEVCLFSLSDPEHETYQGISKLRIISPGIKKESARSRWMGPKLLYLRALPRLKRTVREFKPNLMHAHFATSYGLLGSLTGFHPYILSVWGSDVFEFPINASWKRKLLEFNLRRSDLILSTSKAMATEVNKYTRNEVLVTPFGIDTEIFKPLDAKSLFNQEDIVVGTIKSLEEIYGIDYLIKSFTEVLRKYPGIPLKLLIVGKGSQEESLRALTRELGIESKTTFTGWVNHNQVVDYYNMLDIYCALSICNESFGVAVLEASACELPVIVTDKGGLPEVVERDVTGLIINPGNVEEASQALELLVKSKHQRKSMGKKGRAKVLKEYQWDHNLHQMLGIYDVVRKKTTDNDLR